MTAGLLLKLGLGVKKVTIKSLQHMSPPQEINTTHTLSRSSLCELPLAAMNSTCQHAGISDASFLLFLFCSFTSLYEGAGQSSNNNYNSDQKSLWEITVPSILCSCVPQGSWSSWEGWCTAAEAVRPNRDLKIVALFGPNQNRSRCHLCTVRMNDLPAVII